MFFSLSKMEKKTQKQPTIKHHPIFLLVSKQKVLIIIGISRCNMNSCTRILKTKHEKKIWRLKPKLGAGVI
jgi:hypothetical protein